MKNLSIQYIYILTPIIRYIRKITFVSLLIFVSSTIMAAQISLEIQNQSIRHILKAIEKNSDYRFFYNDDLKILDSTTSISAQQMEIGAVLDKLLANTGITYVKGSNNLIVLTIKDNSTKASSKDQVNNKVKVTGVVKSADGEPIIGANVIEKGSTNGVITDLDGQFSMEVSPNATLEVSYIGFASQDILVKGQSSFTITLNEDMQKIDEVVVTALGIKRQKRSLGYSTATVNGDNFTQARDPNLGNALSGKVAGVSVTGNATGSGGSSRVVIRGNASLTGNNQPLYVIDGVPFDNTNLNQAGAWGGLDMGDGLSNINPDDIADIQVLKSAAASALYGYRGGNGAILITTKSGKKGEPVSVEFNNNLTFNKIYDYRDFQNVFGQGAEGQRPTSAETAKATETLSWGEPMDGQKAINFLGREYQYSPINNWTNFYRTGIYDATSLAISGASEKVTYRFGVSNMYEKGILPNSNISQQGFNMNTTYDILKNLHLSVNANYVFDKSKGRTSLSDGANNTNASLLYRANSFDIRWLERETPESDWGSTASGNELLGGNDIYFNNPYWLQYKRTNEANKNRLTGGITLKYDLFDWLYLQGAVTRDGYNLEYKEIRAKGSANATGGEMWEYEKNYSEVNLNYLIGFNKEFGDWNIGATLGGNRQRNITKYWGTDGVVGSFVIGGFESSNNLSNRKFKKEYSEYQVNSVYATADFGWKNQLFLNLTGRNDWFSTLNPDYNHYFYPSISLSWVFSESFKMPEWFTFGKVRASYASASNGTSPYQNYLTYRLEGYSLNGLSVGTVNNDQVPNTLLKPVRISEWEVGVNLAFFNNRLSLDAAYYTKNTKDDIAMVTTSNASGFSAAIQNVGEIQNNGIETMINMVPVHTRKFQWNSIFNIAYNNSEVKYLGEGVDNLSIKDAESRNGNVIVKNIVGKPYGELTGFKYQRDDQGNVIYKDGIPQRTEDAESLGNGVYKITGGWRNEFTYKDWTLSFLLDFKCGAKLFSGTNYHLYHSGLHNNTLQGRGSDGKGTIIGEGVMWSEKSQSYVPNNVEVSAQTYWQGIVKNNISEEFIYNASFIKLRELSLGYTFPKSLLRGQNVIKNATISLVGRNLWTLLKHTDNIDPESAYNNSNGQGLELNGYPTTRSIGFNVNVKF